MAYLAAAISRRTSSDQFWTTKAPTCEVLALDQLEDEQELEVLLFEAIHRGDVGMVQRREQVRFTAEAGARYTSPMPPAPSGPRTS